MVPRVRHPLDAGANGVVIGSNCVQKDIKGTAALEDHLMTVKGVLRGD